MTTREARPSAPVVREESPALGSVVQLPSTLAVESVRKTVEETAPVEMATPIAAIPVVTPSAAGFSTIEQVAARVSSQSVDAPEPPAIDTVRVKAVPKPFELPPDLVQVETSQYAPPRAHEDSGDSAQPRRMRRAAPETETENQPLVQVETRSSPQE